MVPNDLDDLIRQEREREKLNNIAPVEVIISILYGVLVLLLITFVCRMKKVTLVMIRLQPILLIWTIWTTIFRYVKS